jgi:hypothetical protein
MFQRLTLLAAVTIFLATPQSASASPDIGAVPATVVLNGDLGGRVDGTGWSSAMLKDKVWAMFYVDPDKKDINEKLETSLKEQNFPPEKYGSIAVINMDATWLPNGIIASSLKSKQEKYPQTVYVKDMKKHLVKEWKLADDDYNVIVFDKEGKVRFFKTGAFASEDIEKLIATIKEYL